MFHIYEVLYMFGFGNRFNEVTIISTVQE